MSTILTDIMEGLTLRCVSALSREDDLGMNGDRQGDMASTSVSAHSVPNTSNADDFVAYSRDRFHD